MSHVRIIHVYMILCVPLPNIIEILALPVEVEVHSRTRVFHVPLSVYRRVGSTHDFLPYHIQAMGWKVLSKAHCSSPIDETY